MGSSAFGGTSKGVRGVGTVEAARGVEQTTGRGTRRVLEAVGDSA